jgi:hypothetical protein
MHQLGVLSLNEIRASENLNPVDGGDIRVVPLNMQTLEQANAAAQLAMAPASEPAVEKIVVDEPATPADAPTVLGVLDQYRQGAITVEAAKALLQAAFPQTPEVMVDTILAGVVVPEPEPELVAQEPVAPAPEPVAEEAAAERAEPGSVAEGDFVSWGSAGGRARGRIDHIMDYGTLDIPGTDFTIDATEEDPAALITVWEEVGGGWRATETQVGHKVATLTKIDPLPEPAPEENAYGKPKRKPRKRKADDGTV